METSTESNLASYIGEILKRNNRNSKKLNDYWYPLNVATYGVEEIIEAIDSMCAFQTSMSKKTKIFEEEFGKLFDSEAIMVNSGSSADLLMCFSLHENSGGPLKAGDEILIPAVTWPTQLWSILMAGFTAKFVDIDPSTMNLSIDSLKKSITSKTKAIFLVHLMGNTANINEVKKICLDNNLILLEDCCESLGTKWEGELVGTFGKCASFSFFFSHHITTMEGGMIVTKDSKLADKLRMLRAHGWSREVRNQILETNNSLDSRYTFVDWGFNVRPTELQAGFGSVQLRKLIEFNYWRDKNACLMIEKFEKFNKFLSIMKVDNKTTCSWFALPIIVKNQSLFTIDELVSFLEYNGVETRPIVAGNLNKQPATRNLSHLINSDVDLPGADFVHENCFYIGVRPFDSKNEIARITEIFESFFIKF